MGLSERTKKPATDDSTTKVPWPCCCKREPAAAKTPIVPPMFTATTRAMATGSASTPCSSASTPTAQMMTSRSPTLSVACSMTMR